MLLKIEKASAAEGWVVWMDAWCVKFRSHAEAEAFLNRLNERINASHFIPVSVERLVLELP
ncbi:hypothetical protein [Pseudomonas umsongensis]|uniref:Uncharacterized protein n=1 Tax=Pseudomonas umsongensis TaxID=198618 RepID=A0AAE7DFV5_9PSED|nr:hypothetical protein [Pseudomonas umsongensis]QJC81297.1 hypothetical protein HGP31_24425 [Pseudomonas umsongensis]